MSLQTSNQRLLTYVDALREAMAQEMARAGRLAWTGLSLRAQVPTGDAAKPLRWCVARPDVFSIRHTSVESYVEPIVHEIKVRRSDLLADLRQEAKRGAYGDLGECWYVLGSDARGRTIAEPEEVPPQCGVMLVQGERLPFAGTLGVHSNSLPTARTTGANASISVLNWSG